MRSPENPLPNNSQEMAVAGDILAEQAVLESVRNAGAGPFFGQRFCEMITAIFQAKPPGSQFTVGEIIRELRKTLPNNVDTWQERRGVTPKVGAEILQSAGTIVEQVIAAIVQDAIARRQ